MKKLLYVLMIAGILSSCKALDVVGKESKTSFGAVLDAMAGKIGVDEMTGGWTLPAPDGGVRFIWLPDFSSGAVHDVMLVFKKQPFVDAGLATEKLPPEFTVMEDTIMVGAKLGNAAPKYANGPSPLASYEQIVDLKRSAIGYHGALDHYNIDLGNGNLFEWAKDMGKNDKDMVFVLNPAPFIQAGVDPNRVEGWVFTKVPVDVNGKPTEVDKFLKAFDLL
jgi:hypothetical protein